MRVGPGGLKVQIEAENRTIHLSAGQEVYANPRADPLYRGYPEYPVWERDADVWLSEGELLAILAEALPRGFLDLKTQTCLKLARHFLERAIAQAQPDSLESGTLPESTVGDYAKSQGFDSPEFELFSDDYLELTLDALNQVRSPTEARLTSRWGKTLRELKRVQLGGPEKPSEHLD